VVHRGVTNGRVQLSGELVLYSRQLGLLPGCSLSLPSPESVEKDEFGDSKELGISKRKKYK
jgi:hypothetical protein